MEHAEIYLKHQHVSKSIMCGLKHAKSQVQLLKISQGRIREKAAQ